MSANNTDAKYGKSERKTIKRTVFVSITSFNILNTVGHYSLSLEMKHMHRENVKTM